MSTIGEIMRTVRYALRSNARTARLCVIVIVVAGVYLLVV